MGELMNDIFFLEDQVIAKCAEQKRSSALEKATYMKKIPAPRGEIVRQKIPGLKPEKFVVNYFGLSGEKKERAFRFYCEREKISFGYHCQCYYNIGLDIEIKIDIPGREKEPFTHLEIEKISGVMIASRQEIAEKIIRLYKEGDELVLIAEQWEELSDEEFLEKILRIFKRNLQYAYTLWRRHMEKFLVAKEYMFREDII